MPPEEREPTPWPDRIGRSMKRAGYAMLSGLVTYESIKHGLDQPFPESGFYYTYASLGVLLTPALGLSAVNGLLYDV